MSIKIDLRIFLFGILFFLTKQIEIYAILMIFALLHELGHLCAGLALGFKPKSIGINPLGFKIEFYTEIEDYNKKVKYGNELCLKKIIIASAGPITNLFIILICLIMCKDWNMPINTIIYSNLILAIFNLLPIYPLDGGRIIKEIIHIYKGKKEAEKTANYISKVVVVFLTIITSITILYIHNIAFVLVLAYLWYLVVQNEKSYQIKQRMYQALVKYNIY